MSVGDPGDIDGELIAIAQQHETGDQDSLKLMNTQNKCLKEEEHSNTNPPNAQTRESKIQELLDEEAEKLQKDLDMKCKLETSSTKEREDELEPKSGNGWDLSNFHPWTQTKTPSLTEKLELDSGNKVDATALSFNATKDESLEEEENPKNPLLLIPVIRCLLSFLNIEDIKNCRLVCRDWGSIGKPALASRALIHFHKYEIPTEPKHLPVDFQSCFLESTSNFNAFKISGFRRDKCDSWTVEELTTFFEAQQKYIKELALEFKSPDKELMKKIDLGSWISRSPMVQKNTKHLTKLSIEGVGDVFAIRPFHLITHIKDLSLSNCRIHVEAGIKLSPIKLTLSDAIFYQDGVELSSVSINDLVDLDKIKEVTLRLRSWSSAEYILDLGGSATLEKLILDGEGVEYENGETSEWSIEHLVMTYLPYGLNSKMNIKELYLSDEPIDLFTLPTSIQNLVLPNVHSSLIITSCNQPIVLQNLQYLQFVDTHSDFSFLAHFMHCPQLTHLKLNQCSRIVLKSIWMPKTIKTLTLEDSDHCRIKWNLIGETYWNLQTLVVDDFENAEELCGTKILVDDFIVYLSVMSVDKCLVDFLDFRQHFGFGKRLYIGELMWDDMELEESVLKDHVDVKSAFYVFQDGQKGRPVSERAFHDLIPKHLDIQPYAFDDDDDDE